MKDYNDFKKRFTEAVEYVYKTPVNDFDKNNIQFLYDYDNIIEFGTEIEPVFKKNKVCKFKIKLFEDLPRLDSYDEYEDIIHITVNLPTQEDISNEDYIKDCYECFAILFEMGLDFMENYYIYIDDYLPISKIKWVKYLKKIKNNIKRIIK